MVQYVRYNVNRSDSHVYIQNIIAKNLATYRSKHQLSLDKMANLTGVSKNMLSQIEKAHLIQQLQHYGKLQWLHLPCHN